MFTSICAETTPLQKTMVRGFDAVRSNPCTNRFLPGTSENNAMRGRKDISKAPAIVFTPNMTRTRQPAIITAACTLFLLIITAMPAYDKAIYKASMRAKNKIQSVKKSVCSGSVEHH
ncbi:hypothetical protein J2128_001650 [Methanomicrobium sp. W14]|nr:hypothetical protein [Methanomicrobium sp. W14]MBP2133696.1 hypothetical protein [Methanomicrobium sp. W14]